MKRDLVQRARNLQKVAPSRGRGLKRCCIAVALGLSVGRPFTGAWIETWNTEGGKEWRRKSPLHGGVD